MIERKPSLDDKEGSYCAKIMLLTPFAYQSSRIISSHECYHFNLFLENHLYYLINPNDLKGWIFLAFPPKKKHLRVLVGSNILSWKKEYTFFRSEELFTILACLFVPFIYPVTAILQDAQPVTGGMVSNVPNSEALSLPGNPLEVSAAVSVIDASHHFFGRGDKKITVAGQSGTDFIKNLIFNLISDSEITKTDRITIRFPKLTFDLDGKFFKKCKIPFLYSMNRSIPILNKISHSRKSGSVYFGRYERTSNSSNIGVKFSFTFQNSQTTAIVECKNRKDDIEGNLLYDIFKRAISKYNFKILFIFCRICIRNSTEMSNFTKLCVEKQINVYRIQRRKLLFDIVPFSNAYCRIYPDPKFICIIFESVKINP